MLRALAVTAVLVTLGHGHPARADDPPASSPRPVEARRWYGWELLLADAAAVAMLTVPLPAQAGPVTRGVGMTFLLMNGSIVHMANGNSTSASWSLLRLPSMLVGRFAGSMLSRYAYPCGSPACRERGPTIGGWVGIAPVMIFDYVTAF
jgi:hypothetical protein